MKGEGWMELMKNHFVIVAGYLDTKQKEDLASKLLND